MSAAHIFRTSNPTIAICRTVVVEPFSVKLLEVPRRTTLPAGENGELCKDCDRMSKVWLRYNPKRYGWVR